MSLLNRLKTAYDSGELDFLKKNILVYLRCHHDSLTHFIADFTQKYGPLPLDVLVKYFILSSNLPFDLKDYLNHQSRAIEMALGPDLNSLERPKLVANWVRENALKFREHSLMEQIYCFERMKQDLLPILRVDLNYLA